jgi:hypothetical protein
MKNYSKQCKNTKQVNSFLKSIKLEDFAFDPDYDFPEEFDFDTTEYDENDRGVSVQVSKNYFVSVTKYTKKDIEKLEKELME